MSEAMRFPRTMGNQDALMWSVERDPVMRSTQSAITLLERAPEREVLTAKLERATQDLPRLRQRVFDLPRVLSTPVWTEDPNFDLDYHLRWVRAPRGDRFRGVLDLAASLAMQGFDRTRPLWEFVVVEGLDEGRAAVIQKMHHSVTDGAAGILLMQRVYDRGPDEPFPFRPPDEDEDGGTWRRGGEALLQTLSQPPRLARWGVARLLEFARNPAESARQAADDLASLAHLAAPSVQPLSPIMRARSMNYRFDTLSVPVASLKSAAHGARCKLNDAFLAAVAGGWRRYHARHGASAKELRVSLPINLRAGPEGGVAGNRMMLARFLVPVGIRDPRQRMRHIHKLVAGERRQPALSHVETVAGLLGVLPSPLLSRIFGTVARSVDFVGACVQGLPVPLYLAGARVEALYTFGPTAGTAANITLFSYLERAEVTINSDPAAVPDHDALLECMREGFDEVLKVG